MILRNVTITIGEIEIPEIPARVHPDAGNKGGSHENHPELITPSRHQVDNDENAPTGALQAGKNNDGGDQHDRLSGIPRTEVTAWRSVWV